MEPRPGTEAQPSGKNMKLFEIRLPEESSSQKIFTAGQRIFNFLYGSGEVRTDFIAMQEDGVTFRLIGVNNDSAQGSIAEELNPEDRNLAFSSFVGLVSEVSSIEEAVEKTRSSLVLVEEAIV